MIASPKNNLLRNRADLIALWLLLLLAMWFAADSRITPLISNFDMMSYIAMSEQPTAFLSSDLPGHHAQRALPSLMVWGMQQISPISTLSAFRLISVVALLATVALLYGIFRSQAVSIPIAFGVTVFALIGHWPMTYNLHNVYQANDALVYPLVLIGIICGVQRRRWVFFFLAAAMVFVRQNLFVLASCVYLYWLISDRNWRDGVTWVSVIAVFQWNSSVAGGGAGSELLEHTLFRLFDLGPLFSGIWQSQPWAFLTPFAIVVITRRFWELAWRYWWVTLYAAVTVGQPLLAFELTGVDNAHRIMYQGIWLINLAAGLVLSHDIRKRGSLIAFVYLPLTYGLTHHFSRMHATPPIFGSHHMVNLLVIVLIVVDYWQRQRPLGQFVTDPFSQTAGTSAE